MLGGSYAPVITNVFFNNVHVHVYNIIQVVITSQTRLDSGPTAQL